MSMVTAGAVRIVTGMNGRAMPSLLRVGRVPATNTLVRLDHKHLQQRLVCTNHERGCLQTGALEISSPNHTERLSDQPCCERLLQGQSTFRPRGAHHLRTTLPLPVLVVSLALVLLVVLGLTLDERKVGVVGPLGLVLRYLQIVASLSHCLDYERVTVPVAQAQQEQIRLP